MTNVSFLTNDSGERFVVALVGSELLTARDDHPNFDAICDGVRDGMAEDDLSKLFDPAVAVSEWFKPITRRVSVSNGRLFFDGDEVHNALAKQVLRFMDEGLDDRAYSLVRFFENVQQNPNEHSREQLFEWLDRHMFTITDDGCFVGYKGVNKVLNDDGTISYKSISSGPAIVDGVPVNGHVPNNPGTIVEMARSAVAHDPSVGCSTGLHVGTFEYARDFSRGAVLEVYVHPADVVSVPTDCNHQKLRTCRYEVVDIIDTPYTSAFVRDTDDAADVVAVPTDYYELGTVKAEKDYPRYDNDPDVQGMYDSDLDDFKIGYDDRWTELDHQ
jgi:hypothetical protein